VSGKENTIQQVKQGIPVMLVAQPIEEKELDFFDIWHTLVTHKKLLVVVTSVVTCLGLLYVLLATPIYRSETSLVAPNITDISALQQKQSLIGMQKANILTPENIFELFINQVESKSVLRDFFLHHGVVEKLAPDADTQQKRRAAFTEFEKSIMFDDQKRVLSLEGADPAQIAEWLNEFVRQAEQSAKTEVVANLMAALESEKAKTSAQIEALINIARQDRIKEIIRIEEAIGIAENLNIDDYLIPSSSAGSSKNSGSVSVATTELPLYMRGTKALKSELLSLKARTDDSATIPELADLQEKLRFLGNIKLKTEDFQVMRVDEAALPPEKHIKPKRLLIMIGSILTGFTLGIFSVFFAAALSNHRAREST